MKTHDLCLDTLLDLPPDGGPLHFAGERAVLMDTAALGLLRQQLIHLLGEHAARGLLTRFGYAHGWRTAHAMEHRLPWDSVDDWRRAGGRLHRLQGVVTFEPIPEGNAFAAARWTDSWEADQHLLHHGRSEQPACCTLTGFASGYLSRAFGERIVCLETHCRGKGDAVCRMEGRRAGDWPSEATDLLSFYDQAGLNEDLTSLTNRLHRLEQERRQARSQEGSRSDVREPHGLIARSPSMRRVVELALHVAPVDSTVLITGPSGSGKERVARLIHDHSSRAAGPFLAINCGALPRELLESELFGHKRGAFTGATSDRPGIFEAARHGTLLLDEVGEIPHDVQIRLLRVLQERTVRRVGENVDREIDVRLLAATHRNVDQLVKTGALREDFLYRLRVLRLEVPTLRERRDDILPLAQACLDEVAQRTGCPARRFSRDAVERLLSWPWPGNVRELQNAVEYGAVIARTDVIELADLPPELVRQQLPTPPAPSPSTEVGASERLEDLERAHIERIVALCDGNKAEAARRLGIGRATLYRKLEAWESR